VKKNPTWGEFIRPLIATPTRTARPKMARAMHRSALLLTLVLSCVVAASAKVGKPPKDLTDAEKTTLQAEPGSYSCYGKCDSANAEKSPCGTDRIDTYLGTCNEFKGSYGKATQWGATCPKHVCKAKCAKAGVNGDFHCFTFKTGDKFNLMFEDANAEVSAADMGLSLGCPGSHKMGKKYMAGKKHRDCEGGGPVYKKGEKTARPAADGFDKDKYKKKDASAACKATLERFVCKDIDKSKSKDKCDANDNCKWSADKKCVPKTDGSDAVLDDAYKNVRARAKSKADKCAAITKEADCTGDCEIVNDGETQTCDVKPDVARDAAGVDAVEGMMFDQLEHELHVCNAGKSKKNQTACEAIGKNKGCEWNADDNLCTTSMAHRTDMAAKVCPNFMSDYAGAQRAAADKLREKHKEQKAKAEKKRDEITAKITDKKKKKKVKILADLAIAGKKAKKIKSTVTADSADAACTEALAKAGLTTDNAHCEQDTSSRRKLLASYTIMMIPDPTVDSAKVIASLKSYGYTVTEQDEDPIAVLRTVDGVEAADIDALETEADAAADLGTGVADLDSETKTADAKVASDSGAIRAGVFAAVAALSVLALA